MNIRIGTYAVEIRAHKVSQADEYNNDDAIEFLKDLSYYLDRAADQFSSNKHYALADDALQMANDIYSQLKIRGVYNE